MTDKSPARGGRRKAPVSVLIPTLNEIANIRSCIESVSFADEVVIVDSRSTDGTIEEARRLGAKVVQFDWNGQFPKKKNWALENIQWENDWILILDADERITPRLAREIERIVTTSTRKGYYINRRFMFMGKWLRHCGYYPSWNLRLLRKGAGRYERLEDLGDTGSGDNEVHEHVVLDVGESNSTVGWCKHDMLHYAYPDIATWVEKHNRYSNWEAALLRRGSKRGESIDARISGNPLQSKRWIKKMAGHLPFRPTLRFIYHYIIKSGWRDGYTGLVFCRLLAWYEFVSIAKAEEMRRRDQLKKSPRK
ncbi:MAG: glycosyltransferase family 2 protein [Candidatus Sumerlaeia bacterium]|nr:glycosyltransferase family 2 protein [Candidatus Sumerlaeia bacterium]